MKLFVQQGRFRNRSISIPPAVKGHLEFTPARIKEAIFQIVFARTGGRIGEYAFFDLCAGSGQMAWEALSRGFREVHVNELDSQRFRFLTQEKENYTPGQVILSRRSWSRMADPIVQAMPAVVFLDLPYSFWKDKETTEALDRFIGSLANRQRLILILQSPLAEIPSQYVFSARAYGNHFVLILEDGGR
ncbi:MAG: RsmD family RNA methyltransferase [Spirochaetales bacterium]|nr:RsmD family RNA methyltransferase [Spirochaetales bacterium]